MSLSKQRDVVKSSPLTVAFNAAAFKFKVKAVFIFSANNSFLKEVAVDGVVERRFKLAAPTIETIVEQFGIFLPDDGDESMVASPGVVGGAGNVSDVFRGTSRQALFEERLHGLNVGRNDDELFARGNFKSHAHVTRRHILQHISPICVFMRPRELNGALRKPFGGHNAAHFFLNFSAVVAAEKHVEIEVGTRLRGR